MKVLYGSDANPIRLRVAIHPPQNIISRKLPDLTKLMSLQLVPTNPRRSYEIYPSILSNRQRHHVHASMPFLSQFNSGSPITSFILLTFSFTVLDVRNVVERFYRRTEHCVAFSLEMSMPFSLFLLTNLRTGGPGY